MWQTFEDGGIPNPTAQFKRRRDKTISQKDIELEQNGKKTNLYIHTYI